MARIQARLGNVDGRTKAARRYRHMYNEYRRALAQAPSVAQDGLLRSLVGVSLALELMGAAQAKGEPVDAEELTRLVHTQARLLEMLGLTPKTPDVPPAADPAALFQRVRDPAHWRRP